MIHKKLDWQINEPVQGDGVNLESSKSDLFLTLSIMADLLDLDRINNAIINEICQDSFNESKFQMIEVDMCTHRSQMGQITPSSRQRPIP
jgi:hypothetical protein